MVAGHHLDVAVLVHVAQGASGTRLRGRSLPATPWQAVNVGGRKVKIERKETRAMQTIRTVRDMLAIDADGNVYLRPELDRVRRAAHIWRAVAVAGLAGMVVLLVAMNA